MKITPVFRVWVFIWPIDTSFNMVDLNNLNFFDKPIFFKIGFRNIGGYKVIFINKCNKNMRLFVMSM